MQASRANPLITVIPAPATPAPGPHPHADRAATTCRWWPSRPGQAGFSLAAPSRVVVLFVSLCIAWCSLWSGPLLAQPSDPAAAAAPPAAPDPAPGQAPSASDLAADHYERALIAFNTGEMREAYIEARNALREDPLLLPAHLLLGRIYLALGQGQEAERQLLVADGLGAHRSLIQNSLARAYLLQGRPRQLIDELFPLGTSNDEDAELLALRGEAHLELDEYFDAQRAFTQAWESNPRSVAAILGRVQILLRQGEYDQAVALAREAVNVAPNNARAWYLKGALLEAMGDLSGALDDFNRSVEQLPAYLPAQIGRITVLLRLQRLREAAEATATVRRLYPNDPRSSYLEAVVQTRLGNTAAATAALEEADALINRFPRELIEGHLPSLLIAGIVSFNLKQWDAANRYLERYLAADPDSLGARVLLARIEMEQRGRPQRAIQLLEAAILDSPRNVEALSLLAEAYMRSGQHLRAAQALRTALEQRRGDAVLQSQHAVNRFGLGQRLRAIEDLSAVLSARPDLTSASATLVVMLMQERRFEAATDEARDLLLAEPDNLTYANLLGAALLAAREREAAQWAFDYALALDPGFFPARQNLAELLLQEGQTERARGHLEHILREHEDEASALLLLARSLEAEGDLERARELAQQGLRANPDVVALGVYLTDLLLKLDRNEEAVRIAETIQVRAGLGEDASLLATLSRAYIASGRRSTAQAVLSRASSIAGYDARQLLEIALLQREAGDFNGALWSLQKAVDGEPQFLPTRMRYVEALLEAGRIREATELAEAFTADYPDAPYGDHIMGLIHQHQQDPIAALASFRAAFTKQPSTLLAVRRFEAERAVHGVAAAVANLEPWVDAHPEDGVAAQALG